MAKIAILVPRQSMLEQVLKVLDENPGLKENVMEARVIRTEDSVKEARRVIDMGAHIVVARGLQARIMKEYTKIPVVDIVTTTQEVGLMIRRAQEIVQKPNPKIYMVTWKNTVGDTTYIDEIFDVEFHACCAKTIEEMERMVTEAVEQGADIIIGGDKVERIVKQFHIPSIFSVSTEDSIRNALEIAQKMSYTADIEREFNAQVETILDTTFNGVIRIDRNQNVLMVNRMMEELLKKKSSEVTGQPLGSILPMEDDYVERVLDGRQESCLTSAQVQNTPIMVLIAAIRYDDAVAGAILSCHKLKNAREAGVSTVPEMYLSGYVAKGDFEWFYSQDRQMKKMVELAKKYALSRFPVLIYGEDESETSLFAQSIHNNSLRRNSPFVSVNCAHLSEKEQFDTLFAEKGLLETAKYGTIFIREIDKLSSVCQYNLYRMVSNSPKLLSDSDKTPRYDVRLIAESGRNLENMVREGSFRKDLFYSLNALSLTIPPLRSRPKDIEYLVNRYLGNFRENYSRYLYLTAEGMQALTEYVWEGGITQLEAFCERMFLSASRKQIDAGMVRELLEELYPRHMMIGQEEKVVIYRNPEAEILQELLKKHAGKRSAVAEELGISTTTLWRKMKKLGISD